MYPWAVDNTENRSGKEAADYTTLLLTNCCHQYHFPQVCLAGKPIPPFINRFVPENPGPCRPPAPAAPPGRLSELRRHLTQLLAYPFFVPSHSGKTQRLPPYHLGAKGLRLGFDNFLFKRPKLVFFPKVKIVANLVSFIFFPPEDEMPCP